MLFRYCSNYRILHLIFHFSSHKAWMFQEKWYDMLNIFLRVFFLEGQQQHNQFWSFVLWKIKTAYANGTLTSLNFRNRWLVLVSCRGDDTEGSVYNDHFLSLCLQRWENEERPDAITRNHQFKSRASGTTIQRELGSELWSSRLSTISQVCCALKCSDSFQD